MISGLCYPLWPIVGAMVLLGARRQEPFVHFHALQALALGLVSSAGAVLLVLLMWLILQILPGGSPAFSGVIGLMVFSSGFLVMGFYLSFLLYTAWRASAGRFLRLPFLGSWAEARMQANLDLGPEDYSFDPLPRAQVEEPIREEPEPLEPLIRRNRPGLRPNRPRSLQGFQEEAQDLDSGYPESDPSVSEPDFQPGLLPREESDFQPGLLPREEPDFQPGLLPREESGFQPGLLPREEPRFQPGLFPESGASARGRFKWEPLDPEEEVDSSPGDEFRAW